MNRATLTRWLALLTLGISCILPAKPLVAAEPKATRATMDALGKKYDDAFNKRDATALASLYAHDARIILPEQDVIVDRPAIEKFWKTELAVSVGKQTSTTIEVEDYGEVAFETGKWVIKMADGGIADRGKFLTVWKRTGGQWRIHRETWNLDASVPASANAQKDLARVREEYDRAWLRQDSAVLERLLADDYVQIDPEGKILSKGDVLANARSGEVKFEVGKSDDVKVRTYGNTAVMTGRWTEKSTTKGKESEAVMQNVVVLFRDKGQWQVVSDQVTVIASSGN